MIEIKEISFSRPTKEIFKGFSALVPATGSTLLTGANGSGKTTLINLIGGVLKPNAGCIIINGLDVAKLSAKEQSKIRSVAPQRRIFDLAFTVNQLLEIVSVASRAAHSPDVLEALEIDALADLKITELSIGQQQRVSVALALIQEASFYLLDEPLSAQDVNHQDRTLDLVTMIAKEHGVLVVAHNSAAFEPRFDAHISI